MGTQWGWGGPNMKRKLRKRRNIHYTIIHYNGLFVSIDFTHLTNIVDKTTKVAVSLTNQLDGDIYSLIFCLFTAPGSDRHNCYT